MPRVKSTDQIETLERQQKELLAKLKEAKADARAAEREKRSEKAKIAGTAFLDELDENPSGKAVRTLLVLLDKRLTRKADRARFGFGEAPDAAEGSAGSPAPVEAAGGE